MSNPLLSSYVSIPFGSLIRQNEAERDLYLTKLTQLPPGLVDIVMSPRTGAFLRGVVSTFDIPVEQIARVAFFVLQIVYGQKPLTELAQALTTDLGIQPDTARKVAQEIEKELFASVMLELNGYVNSLKKDERRPAVTPPTSGVRNVLDLKNQPKPPVPPPIPR